VRLAEHVVALGLQPAGELQQVGHRRHEDARGFSRPARPHEPADGLREEQGRRGAGGVDADRQPGHVDALGDHAHRDQPPGAALGEFGDAGRRSGVVGQHDGGRLRGQLRQQGGVSAGRGAVGRDDHAAGVGHVGALLAQPLVGSGDHRGHPFAGGVERRPPRPCGLLGGQRLTQPCGVLLAGAVPPARLPGVGEEHHRPDHTVGESLGVAVGVVGLRPQHPVGAGCVVDERDRAVVAAKGRARQGKSARGVAECLADRLAPRLGVTAVMDLVEDDQGLALFGAHPVQCRMRGDLRVGHHHAVILR